MDDKMNYKTTPAGRTVAQKYADILNCSRPEPSYKHPRMSLQNRAKIFSPFAALRGYDEEIALENLDHQKISKLQLTNEQKEKLGQKLGTFRKGQRVSVTYFTSDPTVFSTAAGTVSSSRILCGQTHPENGIDCDDTRNNGEDGGSEAVGFYHTLSVTVGNVDMISQELRLYTGGINEFGKELPVIIPFDDILKISVNPSATDSTD